MKLEILTAIAESSAVRAGEAQVGDTLNFLKKGSRVEGFLTFPLQTWGSTFFRYC
jgi:hypothetical protein